MWAAAMLADTAAVAWAVVMVASTVGRGHAHGAWRILAGGLAAAGMSVWILGGGLGIGELRDVTFAAWRVWAFPPLVWGPFAMPAAVFAAALVACGLLLRTARRAPADVPLVGALLLLVLTARLAWLWTVPVKMWVPGCLLLAGVLLAYLSKKVRSSPH